MKTLTINLNNGDKLLAVGVPYSTGNNLEIKFSKPMMDRSGAVYLYERMDGAYSSIAKIGIEKDFTAEPNILGTYDTQSGEIDFTVQRGWTQRGQGAWSYELLKGAFLQMLRSSTEKAGITETKLVIIHVAK